MNSPQTFGHDKAFSHCDPCVVDHFSCSDVSVLSISIPGYLRVWRIRMSSSPSIHTHGD